jgi:hypothetical protein
MGAFFEVDIVEAQKFQSVWDFRGVAIPLPPEAAYFARDFANVVIRNFIELCQQQAKEKKELKKVTLL